MGQLFSDWMPVIPRAIVYITLEVAPILGLACLKFHEHKEVFSWWLLGYLVFNAAYHTAVALRAFMDGSFTKHSDRLVEVRKTRNGNTDFITRPQTEQPKP